MVLGIIGGMGPYATVLFYKKLTELTSAGADQEHIACIIYSIPQIPDRTAFLTGESNDSPLNSILGICNTLEKQVDVIAIPCVTSHHFYDEISNAVSVPVMDMHRICAEEAGVPALGVMATEGTVVSGRLLRILREHGVQPVLPSDQSAVTELIYAIKAGDLNKADLFRRTASDMAARGALKILLACSELQVYADLADGETHDLSNLPPLLDATELLARRCIETTGGTLI